MQVRRFQYAKNVSFIAGPVLIPIQLLYRFQKISQGRCADCHSGWRNSDDFHELLLSSVTRNNKNLVVPFEPEESYLVEKLEGSMLRFGGSGLVELVRAWITLGALDN